jgi:hypothetical protein
MLHIYYNYKNINRKRQIKQRVVRYAIVKYKKQKDLGKSIN